MTATVPYNGFYSDDRMGGFPKSYLACKPANADMRIPDEYLDGVCFICVRDVDGNFQFFGTGFFVSVPTSWPMFRIFCLVTAKHNIEKAKEAGHDEIFARMNTASGSVYSQLPITDWLYPENPAVDVAVLPAPLATIPGLNQKSIPIENFGTVKVIQEENIGIGDDVFAIGLFTRKWGKHKNTPIMRTGVIASMPDEEFETDEGKYRAYLVELRSIGGVSGSPVYVNLPFWRPGPNMLESQVSLGAIRIRWKMYLIGVIRSHWDLEKENIAPNDLVAAYENKEIEKRNTGIAVVTPIDEVFKILNGPEMAKIRKEAERDFRKKHQPEPTDDAMSIKPKKGRKISRKKRRI